MNLVSFQFLIFITVLFVFYHCVERPLYHKIVLLAANILFYAEFVVDNASLLIVMTVFSYLITLFIPNNNSVNKKICITVIVLFSIGVLFLYKYLYFFIDCVNAIFSTAFSYRKTIIAPLGLSFYIFKILSYCIDVYRGKIKKASFLDFCIYVSFFPQLASGPIERFEHFEKNINRRKRFDYKTCRNGFVLMMVGMFEKMVLADNIAEAASRVFLMQNASSGTVLAGIFLYSLNIYLDFDAYSNIAIGTAKCLMIETKPNFRTPYMAVSLKDFWDRWHISLSSWLQDYVYIPLGGSRKGKFRKYVNLMIVFLVSGIWHGAALNFILWGFLHGMFQIAEDLIRQCVIIKNKAVLFVTHIFTRLFTFILVSYLWVFFKISDGKEALAIIAKSLKGWKNFDFSFAVLGYNEKEAQFFGVLILITVIMEVLRYRVNMPEWFSNRSFFFRWTVYFVMITVFVIFAAYGTGYDPNYFTYFEF